MPKYSVIVAVHHEIIVEEQDEQMAQAKALKLVNEVFEAFDTETITAEELGDDDQDVTTADDLRMSCG